MPRTEVETKFELGDSDIERLKAIGRITRREEHLNVYYDADWRLADSATTLRIRLYSWAKAVLTLKIPVSEMGRRREMREFDLPLRDKRSSFFESRRPAVIDVSRHLPRQFGHYLLQLGVEEVHRVGWVRNTRLLIEFSNVGHIELDYLRLPDGTMVHEAEIETANDWTRERLADLVSQYAPAAVPATMSKFQRFRIATANKLHSFTSFEMRSAHNRIFDVPSV